MDLLNFGRPDGGEIDWSDPLSQGLGFYVMPAPGDVIDYVSGSTGILAGGALDGGEQVGTGYRSTATTGQGMYWPFPRALEGLGNRYTMMWYGSVGSGGTGQYRKVICLPFRQTTGSWSDPFVALDFGTGDGTTNSNMGYSASSGAYVFNTSGGSGYWQEGTLNCYVASRDGANVEFYRNGVLFHTWTGAGTNSPHFDATGGGVRPSVNITNRNWDATGEGMFGTTLAAAIWARSMSADEVGRLSADPFALVRPRPLIPTYLSLTTSSGNATVTLGILSAAGEILAPTITGSALHAPGVLGADGAILAPTVTGTASVTAALVEANGAILAPTITGTANVTAGLVEASGEILAVSVLAGGNTSVTAALVEASGEVLAPTVTGSAVYAAAVLSAAGEVLAPTITGGATFAAGVLSAAGEVLDPTVSAASGNVTVSVGLLEASAELLALTIVGATANLSDDLLQAIQTWYESQPTLTLAGGLWLEQAPEDTGYPYAVVAEVEDAYDYTTAAGYLETTGLQITLYATSADEAVTLREAWTDGAGGLDFASLGVGDDGGSFVAMTRTGGRLRRETELAATGNTVWVVELDYTADVGRELD
jgi:hypothetical protein